MAVFTLKAVIDGRLYYIVIASIMAWYCTQQILLDLEMFLVCHFLHLMVSGTVVTYTCVSYHLLFNLYMNDISNTLNCCRQGCIVNGVPINHIMYVDDKVLLAPSAHALQLYFLTSVIPMRLVMTLYNNLLP